MKRLLVNLRVALMRPWAVWALFGIAVAVYGLLIIAEARSEPIHQHHWSLFWVYVFPFGWFLLGHHGLEETAAKPFLFLLPGYRESLRPASFSLAVRWGVAFSLYTFSGVWLRLLLFWDIQQIYSNVPASLVPPGAVPARPGGWEISLSLLGGFFGGMGYGLFWTCVSLVHFRRKGLGILFGCLTFVLVLLLIAGRESQHPLVIWPVLTLLGVFFCVYFWRRLGDLDWVKSGHRALIFHAAERHRHIVARIRSCLWVEGLFLTLMRRKNSKAVERYVWGSFYEAFGLILSHLREPTAAILVAILVQGYVPRLVVEFLILAFGSFATFLVLPRPSTSLLPEGRGVRCRLSIMVAAFTTLLLLVVYAGGVVLSRLLASLLPPITLGGHYWRYVGISLTYVWVACLPVPWLFALGPLGNGVPLVRSLLVAVVALVSIVEIFFRKYGLYQGPALLPGLLVCGWILLPFALWITYRRWDLVGQRPLRDD